MDLSNIVEETELNTLFDYIDDLISIAETADDYIEDDRIKSSLSSEIGYVVGKLSDVKQKMTELQDTVDNMNSKVVEVQEIYNGEA